MRIRQGEGYRIPVTVQQRNLDGTFTLVDPGTIVGTLLFPDHLTTATFTPTKDSVGQYHADLAPSVFAQLGPYQWKVVTTGAGAGVSAGSFDVVDPFEASVLSLDDAKAQLNITSTANDDELGIYLNAATTVVEGYVGAVTRRTVTAVVAGGYAAVLPVYPVISLTSLTAQLAGVATYTDMTAFDVNAATGVIRLRSGGWIAGPQRVVYEAGRVSVPPNIGLAARIIVQHLWSTQRGGASRPGMGGSGDVTDQQLTLAGFAVPRRAVELLLPSIQPGFA